MSKVLYYLEILWELPQFIIGCVLGVYYSRNNTIRIRKGNTTVLKVVKFNKGISLGKVVIVGHLTGETTIRHELGHSRQSVILGPFYLLIIGIPSLLHNVIHKLFKKRWNYYGFYTERWADKIADINR